MLPQGQQQNTDFLSSLLTDGAKFLRIADDVHYLMDQMSSISVCMYALTAGVYLAIVVYVVVVCYKERRTAPESEALMGGGGTYTMNPQYAHHNNALHAHNPDSMELGTEQTRLTPMGGLPPDYLGYGDTSVEQEILPSSAGGPPIMGSVGGGKGSGKMGARLRGAYRRQYTSASTLNETVHQAVNANKKRSTAAGTAGAQRTESGRTTARARYTRGQTQASLGDSLQQQQGGQSSSVERRASAASSHGGTPPIMGGGVVGQSTAGAPTSASTREDFDPSAALSVV